MRPLTRSLIVLFLALAASAARPQAAVLFTYDFPGSPGSGLAANQTNPEPAWETFGDFTATSDLTQMPGAPANGTFATENWSQTGSINTSQYEGFTITAGVGIHLDLSSLQFDASLKPSGPTNMEVRLFLNGSATAYATYDFSPTPPFNTYTFNFTPLVDTDNVTSATFLFYGWNAVATGGGIALDNVITNGLITPEPGNGWFALLPAALALGDIVRRRWNRRCSRGRLSPP